MTVLQPLLPKEVGGRAPPLGDGPVELYRAESLRAYSAVACALPVTTSPARSPAQPSQRELMRAFISLIRCLAQHVQQLMRAHDTRYTS